MWPEFKRVWDPPAPAVPKKPFCKEDVRASGDYIGEIYYHEDNMWVFHPTTQSIAISADTLDHIRYRLVTLNQRFPSGDVPYGVTP